MSLCFVRKYLREPSSRRIVFSKESKPTICLDFDGVVNNYKGWRDEGFDVILDKPVPGVKKAIKKLREDYTVVIHSVRCAHRGGRQAIIDYLKKNKIKVDGVTANKPLASMYIDDKAIPFDGDWNKTLRRVKRFKQWNYND